ncbi:cytochrome d ubiquinol oxidase subunit II [Streptomyces macrosporus]|uniref:cytochrome d ubiquinol oxidase subunit II n=1 Tax=Streptomyces macrosporus TaxID=44032 RepID=UPI0031CFA35E
MEAVFGEPDLAAARTGLPAVGTAAYPVAVYLTRDAQRVGDADLVRVFRRRALWAGTVVGALSAVGLVVLRADARPLFDEPTSGAALPFLVLSVVAGVVSLLLLVQGRHYLVVRLTAALAVVGLLWGRGIGQYPDLLPGVTLDEAAATDTVLSASLGALAVGAVLLLPSLWWLYVTFQRDTTEEAPEPTR